MEWRGAIYRTIIVVCAALMFFATSPPSANVGSQLAGAVMVFIFGVTFGSTISTKAE